MSDKLSNILKTIKPEKITLIKTDRIMLHVEPLKSGGLRITYSQGFLDLTGCVSKARKIRQSKTDVLTDHHNHIAQTVSDAFFPPLKEKEE